MRSAIGTPSLNQGSDSTSATPVPFPCWPMSLLHPVINRLPWFVIGLMSPCIRGPPWPRQSVPPHLRSSSFRTVGLSAVCRRHPHGQPALESSCRNPVFPVSVFRRLISAVAPRDGTTPEVLTAMSWCFLRTARACWLKHSAGPV